MAFEQCGHWRCRSRFRDRLGLALVVGWGKGFVGDRIVG
jgi:hypothetical protein